MKAYRVFLIILPFVLFSCVEEDIVPGDPLIVSGDFGPFSIGRQWGYKVYGHINGDLYEGAVQLENSGVLTIAERNYVVRNGTFLRYSAGKYFNLYQDTVYLGGRHEEFYLDEDLNMGEHWMDTVEFESTFPHIYKYEVIRKSSFEMSILRSTVNDLLNTYPKEVFTYQKNVGLVKQVSQWPQGEITWRLMAN